MREGLEQFRDASPDVVVCDLAMPEQDGFAFLGAIRAFPGSAGTTPVIALTAFGRPEDRERALSAGFDLYLRKPVDPHELSAAVSQLATRRRSTRDGG